jgi:F-type H+-transporting ATPase subunit b
MAFMGFTPKARKQAAADEKQLEAVEQAKLQAAHDLIEAKRSLEEAQRQADDIIAAAKKTADKMASEVRTQARREARQIVADARETAENNRRSALIELSDSVANLSIEMAGRLIDEQLDDEHHRALVERALAEMGSFSAN